MTSYSLEVFLVLLNIILIFQALVQKKILGLLYLNQSAAILFRFFCPEKSLLFLSMPISIDGIIGKYKC